MPFLKLLETDIPLEQLGSSRRTWIKQRAPGSRTLHLKVMTVPPGDPAPRPTRSWQIRLLTEKGSVAEEVWLHFSPWPLQLPPPTPFPLPNP